MATANGAHLFNHYGSNSRFIHFTSRNTTSKLFLTKTSHFRTPNKRSFHLNNTLTDKIHHPITEQGGESDLSSFAPDASITSSIKYHAEFTPVFSPERFELPKAFFATAQSVRDSLLINWNATYDVYEKLNMKQAYYLSMEFLQGRALLNAIGNLELTGAFAEALKNLGHNLENVASQEPDAALGNGGLGRLASCFLDSLATLNYPAWGYGLRYKYGLFKQRITKDGQEEVAEEWLEIGSPWEVVRNDVSYPIKFYGKVSTGSDGKRYWIGGEDIKAVAYDVPIPGYKTRTTISLRLWSTQVPSADFDLSAFNAGEHTKACEAQASAEKICYILYPGDESEEGKILRLKQQYTLCSASLQDIISRFERRSGDRIKWEEFPEKVAVQMNDTHPTLCIPELMRILIDLKNLNWNEAWNITQRTVAYTNHTVLPEALEKWSYELMQKLLPRHVEIIEAILVHEIVSKYGSLDLNKLEEKLTTMRILENFDLPSSVAELFIKPEISVDDDTETVEVHDKVEASDKVVTNDEDGAGKKTSVKTEAAAEKDIDKKTPVSPEPAVIPPKKVRMANLCVVGGHAVNGVAEIHSEIVKEEVFNDFYKLWPEKFQNKTNGVTPRRWIRFCNPPLSAIITKWTGTEDWVLKTEKLAELQKFADNEDLQNEWRKQKGATRLKLSPFSKKRRVKRIPVQATTVKYLGIIYRYKKMKEMTAAERKTNPKRIVKFITDVGATINHDPEIGDLLKVVFVPDYNVSVAELLIPASDLSEHISTAGMEASGTSNMKFAMNGCIQIGTLDGANVEIREEVGEENFFLFGAQAHEIAALRKERADGKFVPDERFEEVKEFVRSAAFGSYNYDDLIGSLEGNECFGRADYFLVGKDFPSYIECQEKVDEAYRDQKRWTKMSILNTAGSYKFSSDRTIHEYAKDIWNIEAVEIA
ncbi:hypothetical protein R3W88_007988 [Solanum pinnatisectum]|uniref:Alpha-1,4 glucan phosphorylase n=1 Tax=Solanum pinnatisectum TaxID=50273 RepID=A0AAV9M8L2_9SOLN|nr:hypothetical protein R3W88_007988 [Solanum pinnatisectum]